ncbi:MAG: hypothetical protein IT371_09905 [Deltaproteobacteria bacterium]|nr:hypothetical protein [Deltaproteobacteria bacterium]
MFQSWPAMEGSDPERGDAVFWWLVRLRWVTAVGVALLLVFAGPVLQTLPMGSAPKLWATVVGLLAYNTLLALLGPRPTGSWFTRIAGQIAVDCVALAILVHFGGGIENPFLPLFVLHIVNANIVLSARAASGVLGLTVALVAATVLAEGTGLVEHHCLRRAGEHCTGRTLDLRALGLLGGLILALVATSLVTRFSTARLRLGQRLLSATVDELTAERQQLANTRAQVEAERTRLQAMIDCMDEAVILLGPTGELLFTNRRAQELWDTRGALAALQLAGVLPHEIEGRLDCATFERAGRTFEATRSPVQSAPGETLGLVMVVRDVTDRLAREKHHMHEERMSEVGKLAATVAHEINNLIGVVSLYSQHALAKLSRENPIFRHVETIRRSAEGCREVVCTLLNLARAPKPVRCRVDLRQLCRDAIDSVRPLAAHAGVRLSSGSHASDVPIWAEADAGMLHQAVLELVMNVIEAGSARAEISIGAYETQDGEATAHTIEVRDTGAAITSGEVEQAPPAFFTIKATDTGLGLSVAENIVKSHDGRIEVQGVVGTGSLFRIVLPDRTTGAELSPAPAPRRADGRVAERDA